MKLFIKLIFYGLFVFLWACQSNQNNRSQLVEANFEMAARQLSDMLNVLGDSKLNPRSIHDDGSLRLVLSRDWTSGFFPGCLWLVHKYFDDAKWQEAAHKFTMNVEAEQFNATTHDMGFKMYCSFGNGYKLTENELYHDILMQSAKTLITRFNPNVGCIRSWDHHADIWQFPVIIDNMMNLELLFWATKVSGDSTFCNIAKTHAETTLKNHFRSDNSSWHVLNYDTTTGAILDRHSHQGYEHESSWARGQAWGLYGFTMSYRETKDERFLKKAKDIADFILNHKNLPEDFVPYWDFDASEIPNEPRDVSSAAIMCSALYELSTHLELNGQSYKETADKILESLSSPAYLAEAGTNQNLLLKHAVGNFPQNDEIDVPIIYADYYFLEANLRRMEIESQN